MYKTEKNIRHLLFYITSITFLISPIDSIASKQYPHDTIAVEEKIHGFYNWYLGEIKQRSNKHKPQFIRDSNGMTTLELETYLNTIKRLGFSDSLLEREKRSYQNCIENLNKVKYEDFSKTTYVDLDDFEMSNCDFGNYYRWIGGQEPVDGIRVKHIAFKASNAALVTIEYCHLDSFRRECAYSGINIISLFKIDGKWHLDRFSSWP